MKSPEMFNPYSKEKAENEGAKMQELLAKGNYGYENERDNYDAAESDAEAIIAHDEKIANWEKMIKETPSLAKEELNKILDATIKSGFTNELDEYLEVLSNNGIDASAEIKENEVGLREVGKKLLMDGRTSSYYHAMNFIKKFGENVDMSSEVAETLEILLGEKVKDREYWDHSEFYRNEKDGKVDFTSISDAKKLLQFVSTLSFMPKERIDEIAKRNSEKLG